MLRSVLPLLFAATLFACSSSTQGGQSSLPTCNAPGAPEAKVFAPENLLTGKPCGASDEACAMGVQRCANEIDEYRCDCVSGSWACAVTSQAAGLCADAGGGG